MRRTTLGVLILAPWLSACGGEPPAPEPSASPKAPPASQAAITLTSPAFQDGGMIPAQYTCRGEDISPPLAWSGAPEAAKSLALIVEDPDAPGGTFTHWVLYDLPPSAKGIEGGRPADESLLDGSRQGRNDFKKVGYGGPCPPSGTHRYYFKIYALDVPPGMSPGLDANGLKRAMDGHVLAEGQLMGKFAKP